MAVKTAALTRRDNHTKTTRTPSRWEGVSGKRAQKKARAGVGIDFDKNGCEKTACEVRAVAREARTRAANMPPRGKREAFFALSRPISAGKRARGGGGSACFRSRLPFFPPPCFPPHVVFFREALFARGGNACAQRCKHFDCARKRAQNAHLCARAQRAFLPARRNGSGAAGRAQSPMWSGAQAETGRADRRETGEARPRRREADAVERTP